LVFSYICSLYCGGGNGGKKNRQTLNVKREKLNSFTTDV
jgi:hypothetical protein